MSINRQTKEILDKVFCSSGPYLGILVWIGYKSSRGQTRNWRTHTHAQTDAGNDNTRRPKLASSKMRVNHNIFLTWLLVGQRLWCHDVIQENKYTSGCVIMQVKCHHDYLMVSRLGELVQCTSFRVLGYPLIFGRCKKIIAEHQCVLKNKQFGNDQSFALTNECTTEINEGTTEIICKLFAIKCSATLKSTIGILASSIPVYCNVPTFELFCRRPLKTYERKTFNFDHIEL